MRDGYFEVTVLQQNGQAYAERAFNGAPGFCTEAGQEFRVHVAIHNVWGMQLLAGQNDVVVGLTEAPDKASVAESKKFWQQPSLAAEAGGRLQVGLPGWDTRKFEHDTTQPMRTLELHYHTAAMATTLDRFVGPSTGPSSAGSSSASSKPGDGTGVGTGMGTGVKTGVKTEGRWRARGRKRRVIDLTGSPERSTSSAPVTPAAPATALTTPTASAVIDLVDMADV
ncbi:hypothetical protein B484DRAFT_395879 [Ochromonadaceae sp. CCMP2298]|nr:hypothetical protein B484DRAFT_395879 [Ochromonadaceae sp. CCMP2298]